LSDADRCCQQESHNLAAAPEHASRVSAMKARLAEVGRSGIPPAYVFEPKAAEAAANARACTNMQESGCKEPADWVDPSPRPAPPPGPAPGPDPEGGGTISEAVCARAHGLLDKHKTACCPASCGKCGGSDCGDLPGGRDNCCSHQIMSSKRLCSATTSAPCHG